MISLQMPDQAHGILRRQARIQNANEIDTSLFILEVHSRPNLERYHLRPSIYEKEEKKLEQSF